VACYALNRFYARHFHQLTVLSPCPLPRNGPAIIVSNHTSALDPSLIQSASNRLIRWMMAKEYYEMPSFKRMFELIDSIPVNRNGNDVGATRAALRVLDKGEVLGVFPEGRSSAKERSCLSTPGSHSLRCAKRVNVYPTWIDGTQRNCKMVITLTKPQTARVRFGPPIALKRTDDRTCLDQITQRYQEAVAKLRTG